jgi:ribosomal subunit interface protein
MRHNIKFTNLDSSLAVEEAVAEKLSYLERYIPAESLDNVFTEVEVGRTTAHHRQGEILRAEINVRLADGTQLRAEAKSENIMAALEEAKEKMAKEMRRYANKKNSLLKKGGRVVKSFLRRFYPGDR